MIRFVVLLVPIIFLSHLILFGQNQYLIDLGWQKFKEMEYDSAIYYYNASIKKFPEQKLAYKYRGIANNDKGQFRKAVDDFNLALVHGLDSLDICYLRMKSFFSLQKYDSSIYDINYLIKRSNSNQEKSQLLALKGLCYTVSNRLNDSEVAISKALQYDSSNFTAHSFHVLNLISLQKGEKALAISEKLVKSDPLNPYLYFLKGLSYIQLKNPASAIESIKEAIKITKEENAEYYSALGTAFNLIFDFNQGLENAEKSIRINPNTSEGHMAKGYALWGKFKYKEAIEETNLSIKLSPNDAISYLIRGKSYYGLKNYQLAEKDLNRCVKLDNKIDDAFIFLGYICKELGKKNEACLNWKKAYDLGAIDIEDEMKRYCK